MMCVYCHKSIGHGTKDHFIPRAYEGSDKAANKVRACKECNQIKRDILFESVEEAAAFIKQQKERRAKIAKKTGWNINFEVK